MVRQFTPSTSYRAAFTLLELIVVLAILGVLLALSAAAIQRTRDAAARASCMSRLRQLVTAVHGYHDAYQRLPAGCDKRPASLLAGG
jgi:prepilin-type N-terminal cleavage/methylation domain-containing protein